MKTTGLMLIKPLQLLKQQPLDVLGSSETCSDLSLNNCYVNYDSNSPASKVISRKFNNLDFSTPAKTAVY